MARGASVHRYNSCCCGHTVCVATSVDSKRMSHRHHQGDSCRGAKRTRVQPCWPVFRMAIIYNRNIREWYCAHDCRLRRAGKKLRRAASCTGCHHIGTLPLGAPPGVSGRNNPGTGVLSGEDRCHCCRDSAGDYRGCRAACSNGRGRFRDSFG